MTRLGEMLRIGEMVDVPGILVENDAVHQAVYIKGHGTVRTTGLPVLVHWDDEYRDELLNEIANLRQALLDIKK